ncbi:hypothetical protein BJ170DRAFT_412259 [Xylariales sp. AK1849]|nr:hypothetical protein BJ170DRAFT_412259 [Xylariales sp. AK1849]
MLRRPPTTLTLTSEDVALYEDKRAREAYRRANSQHIPSIPRFDSSEQISNPARRTILDPPLGSSSEHDEAIQGFAGNNTGHPGRYAKQHGGEIRAPQMRSANRWTPLNQPGGEGLSARLSLSDEDIVASEDEDDDEDDEDESDAEMADYDPAVPGHMQSLPRSGRPTQPHHHASMPPPPPLSQPVPQAHPAVTPTFNHTHQQTPNAPNPLNSTASHIPQAPARPAGARHHRTTSSRGGGRGLAGGRGETQEPARTLAFEQAASARVAALSAAAGSLQTGAASRTTRTRDERIGVNEESEGHERMETEERSSLENKYEDHAVDAGGRSWVEMHHGRHSARNRS